MVVKMKRSRHKFGPVFVVCRESGMIMGFVHRMTGGWMFCFGSRDYNGCMFHSSKRFPSKEDAAAELEYVFSKTSFLVNLPQ